MTFFWFGWFSNLLAGVLLGGVLFTSFLTAPIVFIVLDQKTATKFTRVLWPRYFVACFVLGLLLTGLIYVHPGSGPALWLCLGFTVLMGTNFGIARRIRSLRGDDLGSELEGTVSTLHGISVWINYTCLLLILLVHYFISIG